MKKGHYLMLLCYFLMCAALIVFASAALVFTCVDFQPCWGLWGSVGSLFLCCHKMGKVIESDAVFFREIAMLDKENEELVALNNLLDAEIARRRGEV